jgi:hypothetical protein
MVSSREYQSIFNIQDGAAQANISPGLLFKMAQVR